MKKIIKSFLMTFLAVVAVVAVAGCSKKEAESVKEATWGELAAYSMDLSSISGYESYVVTAGTWAETYDVIISLAKKEADDEKRTALYHEAEDLLMSTGTIVPLYFYTDIYMIDSAVTGFFATPTGSKFFKYTEVGGSGESIAVCLASEPDTIDPALNSSVDGATYILHCFSGLVGYNSEGELVADLCTELPSPVANADGSVTYTFEIRSDAKWSDGTAITAADFVYSWNRAIAAETAADYGYLFEIIKGYSDGELAVSASADGSEFSVVLPVDVPYFFELCAFPTFMPVQKAAVEGSTDGWATAVSSYVTSGAYKLSSWTHDSKIVLVKNDEYWNADSITMEEIEFYLSDNDTAILSGFKNDTYDFIDSVPNDEIAACKTDYANEFVVAGQLGTYYVIFNNNTDLVPSYVSENMSEVEKLRANEEIRYALSLLIDRNYIAEEIGQAGQEPASSFVAMGITNADGSEFYESAGSSSSYNGYYNVAESAYSANCAEAIEILSKYFEYDKKTGKFTNFTKFDYLYNTGSGHQAIGEYIQSVYSTYGITMTLTNQEWNTFLNTRKDGDYTIARNGWLADYNDPINMLDMWTSYSGNNDAQLGK